jgi:hypothetical protein
MMYKQIITVYCENRKKHINTLCEQRAAFKCVKTGGIYSNHWTRKG